jgi:hypothetical protein
VSGRKRAAARAARLAAAKDWPALPGDEHIRATEQFLWAIDEMAASRLDWKAAPFAIIPAISAAWPEVPAAWDRLLDELLERFPCGTVPPVLAKYLTVRLVERCPDMARLQRVAKLVRLVLGGDDIGKREIGKPEAVMHAARYYYHYRRLGVAVGVREIAQHVGGVSPTLVARWVSHWKRGEAYDQLHYYDEKYCG